MGKTLGAAEKYKGGKKNQTRKNTRNRKRNGGELGISVEEMQKTESTNKKIVIDYTDITNDSNQINVPSLLVRETTIAISGMPLEKLLPNQNLIHINYIIAHKMPWHADEYFSLYELLEYGSRKYSGIDTAKIIFVPVDATGDYQMPDEKPMRDWHLRSDVLFLGKGGGRLDEHNSYSNPEKKGECCATLTAKDLGIEFDPTLQKLLENIRRVDSKGGRGFTTIDNVVMLFTEENEFETAKQWVFLAFDKLIADQCEFHEKAIMEYRDSKNKVIRTITGPDDEKGNPIILRICCIKSDTRDLFKAARWFCKQSEEPDISIFIQENTDGHIQILTDQSKTARRIFPDIVRLIRFEENSLNGNQRIDWQDLDKPEISVTPFWYYHTGLCQLTNGNPGRECHQPPTKIAIARVIELIRLGANPNYFADRFYKTCRDGKCFASKNNHCPLFNIGLERCALSKRNRKEWIGKKHNNNQHSDHNQ